MSEYLDDYIKNLSAAALKSRQLTPETIGPYGLAAEIALHYLAEEPTKRLQFINAIYGLTPARVIPGPRIRYKRLKGRLNKRHKRDWLLLAPGERLLNYTIPEGMIMEVREDIDGWRALKVVKRRKSERRQ